MDRFITRSEKTCTLFDDVKGAVCVWGPYGCGKTTWVKEQLKPLEIDYDDPEEFMARVGTRWVLVDNFEALDPKVFCKWYARPMTVYISARPIEEIHCHEHTNKKNLRDLFGARDIHMDPKDYLVMQMTSKCDPLDAIHKCGSEHGNGLGIIFANYQSVCSLDEAVELMDSLSIATLIDQRIYRGNWDYETRKYFNFHSFTVPLSIIKGRTGEVTSATLWTKFLNECMKRKKLREAGLDHDSVEVARAYAIREQNPLDLDSSQLDALKIGDLTNKLKAKTVQKLKKCTRRKNPP